MAQPLNTVPRLGLFRRRLLSAGRLLFVLAWLFVWLIYQRDNLGHDAFQSGYFLFAAIVFLAAYNLRKKLPAIPWLGSSARWMQLHIYVAIGSFVVFISHVGWEIPNGVMEQFLAAIYLVVFGSGLLGLYWSRSIPGRLTAVGEQVLFEQIPVLRRGVAQQVRSLLFDQPAKSIVLARYYVQRLARFFEQARPVTYLAYPNGRERRAILNEIEDLDRYLTPTHQAIGRQLAELVRRKDDLDYHRALQGRLKIWLFLHIGLTYSLMILAIAHGVAVHLFHGGLP
jgi:hypothetical protein